VDTNQAESFFSRMRRAEIGQHHHIGIHLHQYAGEMTWNNRGCDNSRWDMSWRSPYLAAGMAVKKARRARQSDNRHTTVCPGPSSPVARCGSAIASSIPRMAESVASDARGKLAVATYIC
jgi:hypothetical protein